MTKKRRRPTVYDVIFTAAFLIALVSAVVIVGRHYQPAKGTMMIGDAAIFGFLSSLRVLLVVGLIVAASRILQVVPLTSSTDEDATKGQAVGQGWICFAVAAWTLVLQHWPGFISVHIAIFETLYVAALLCVGWVVILWMERTNRGTEPLRLLQRLLRRSTREREAGDWCITGRGVVLVLWGLSLVSATLKLSLLIGVTAA